MATHINDAKFEALATLTGVRTDINDMEWRWLYSIVTPRRGTINDMWKWVLEDAGYSSNFDMLVDVLGYVSDINSMWLDYWLNFPGSGIGGAVIVLSVNTIAESATSGSVVGALSVTGGSGSYTFSITADPDNKFAIDGSNLETDAALNYEAATSHSVTIEADNGVDTPISRTFTITVTNVTESGTAPDAFTVGQWSVADNAAGNSLTITILTVPGLNGNTQTGTQYRVDGGDIHTSALVGTGDIVIVDGVELINDVEVNVEIRVLTDEYTWPTDEDGWSDVKTETPTLITTDVPDAFVVGEWSVTPTDTAISVTISVLPYDNGATITDIEYRVDGGTWTSSGGTTSFSITSLTNGVEYDIELRAVNSIGAGAAGDLKSAEPVAPSTWVPSDETSGTFDLWLDGSDAATFTINSGFVEGWTDKSGSGNHATASGGARPTEGVGGGIALNGSQHMFSNLSSSDDEQTILAVVKIASTGVRTIVGSNGTGGPRQFRYNNGELDAIRTTTEQEAVTSGLSVPTGVYVLVEMQLEFGAQTILGKNGTLQTSTGLHDTAYGGTNTSMIGGSANGGENMVGEIVEVLAISPKPGSTLLGNMRSYLMDNWGITP